MVQPASPVPAATVVPSLAPPLAARPPAPMPGPARTAATARAVPSKVPVGKTEPARAAAVMGDDLMVPTAFRPASPPAVSRAATGPVSADDRLGAEELIWLAERAFQAGHPVEAVRLGKKALAAHGGARAHLALAAAYFDLRRYDDARASYRAVLQAEPGNETARIGLDLAEAAQTRPQP